MRVTPVTRGTGHGGWTHSVPANPTRTEGNRVHTRRTIIRSVLAAGMAGTVASTVLAAPALAAPVTGSLAGVVRDTRGAAMAGAGIEIYDNPDAGAVIATGQTDAAGRFKVPGLNPGTYEVEVHLAGGWSDWAPGRTATRRPTG
jgi:protocatechuate 3,4-dioxygenase beta subunit